MSKTLVIKIVIEFILLCAIYCICGAAVDNCPNKKRFYKVMMGFAYMVTALLSIRVADYFGRSIYFYTAFGFIFSLGSFLSAINTNLREIYTAIFGCMFWLVIAYYLRSGHKTISIILAILGIGGLIVSIKESIENMLYGIDPDIVEEEKSKRRKLRHKLLKYAIKAWRM